MTETELVLASLTVEELDDARRFVASMEASWIAGTKDRGTERWTTNRTDGPLHALTALKLAILREMVQRGGAEPWYAGMPVTGHPAEELLRLYQRRFGYRDLEPRPNAAGVLERICAICGEAKPQDEATFERIDGLWSDRCRACDRPDVSLIPPDAIDVPVVVDAIPEGQLELL